MDRLIDLVRQNPCLYDSRHKHYMDKMQRQDVWNKIARDWKVEGLCPKSEWRKLRDCHRDALKRRSHMPGAMAPAPKKWKYTDQMDFLLPYMGNRYAPATTTPEAAFHDAVAPDVKPAPPMAEDGTSDEDALDLFFGAMCETMKKLPKKYQMRIKKVLFQAVQEAEESWEAEVCVPPPEAVNVAGPELCSDPLKEEPPDVFDLD